MAKYQTKESESKRQKFREENEINKFDIDSDKPVYSIDTPPPTVSGKLHIGHISSYTQAEIIARYKRMKGYNVYYPMGFDNNGIPTEQLVERDLKINIKEMDRKDFIQKCLEVNENYVNLYENLWKSLGLSVDWTKVYSTIELKTQQIVQQEFVKLYNKGHIVSKEFPALRCTKLQATIAQAETEDCEFEEFFNDIEFTLEDGTKLTIATTRPELLPACKAVFAHPNDDRYKDHFHKNITTPLGETVPLLPDDKAKIDKGTGLVMCCSYGDETDVFWFQKHNLEPRICIDRYGKMTNTGLEEIDGLKIKDARVKIMEILKDMGVVKNITPITQSKAISERGKVPVEIIPVHQWFVNILDNKETLLTQNDKMNRYPNFMKKRSNDWIENLHWDWNISRNRKFGIPIPVRYNLKNGEIILPSEAQLAKGPVDPSSDLPEGYTSDQVKGETLVLDTWFTSGLSPLINKKLLEKDGYDTKDFFPMDLRPQAHDIIRTWLLYTTLHSYFRENDIPFKNIMISGFVLAAKGEKFSKSKGNAKLDPEQLIEQRGADAIRYRCAGGQLGKDMLFEDSEFKNGQKLVTKLRNASNFVQMLNEGFDPKSEFDTSTLLETDKWILAKTNATIKKMEDYLEKYEYGLAKIAFEDFFWADFCDNYLEMVKLRLYKPELFENGEQKKLAGQWTLYHVLFTILKLIAPYLPHISEEIYQNYFKKYEEIISIHKTGFPTKILEIADSEQIIKDFDHIATIVETARKFKTEKQISMGAELKNLIISGPKDYLELVKKYADDITGVTKTQNIEYLEKDGISCICEL
ncbi:MAG TPA: valine--tRNA ligase [Candidatus Absconditabacterales bacterium]|nr:valine--tRNA ligase [Candidatus Absconditabacterales bacterium]